jgi:hypothetical protein
LHLFKSPSEYAPSFKFPNYARGESTLNKKIPVVFKYNGKIGKEVFLIGTFTSWKDKIPMIKT